jgi:hypothetical protein
MIALSGTFTAREPCDQTKGQSIFTLHSQGENALTPGNAPLQGRAEKAFSPYQLALDDFCNKSAVIEPAAVPPRACHDSEGWRQLFFKADEEDKRG